MNMKRFKKYQSLFLILVILVIAGFFRLWRLDSIPPGLYPDVAQNGMDAIGAMETGEYKVFYPNNNGREGLFINLIAFSFRIFGVSIFAMNIVAALAGIFTILGLYLLTKEIFNEKIALLSSFFTAVSFWHINFSRIAFRAILTPLFLVFSFYFLFKGFREKKIWNFALSGIFFGLGFHTYIAFRVAPLIVLIVLLNFLFIYWKSNLQKKWLTFTFCFLIFTFIVALPIGIYFIENPNDFIGRATDVSIFAAEDEPAKAFASSFIKTLGMFNFKGDGNWRHNYVDEPMLYWPVGIFFALGLFISIIQLSKKIKRSFKKEDINSKITNENSGFLISWFLIMLLPAVSTAEGIPHALRTIGVIPVVYIFTALGFYWSVKKANLFIGSEFYPKFLKKISKPILEFTIILFLLNTAAFNFNKYFFDWAKNPEVRGAFLENLVGIGNYFNSLSSDTKKYVIVNQGGGEGFNLIQTIRFTTYPKENIEYLKTNELDKITLLDKKTVIVIMTYDKELFSKLQTKFKKGKIEEKDGFWIYQRQNQKLKIKSQNYNSKVD